MRFNSEFTLTWIIPMLIFSALFAFWFYKNQTWLSSVSKRIKWLLIVLRSFGIFGILVLLLGIIFNSITQREEKPILIAVFDTSTSLLNYKDSAKVVSQITDFKTNFTEKYSEKYQLAFFGVGESFGRLESIKLDNQRSNLAQAFESIHASYYNRNIGGVIFVSDGNFNDGNTPIYSAEKLGLTPIFTIGVGDTTTKKDQLIRDVSSNEIAFLKNKFPIEVDVEAFKMGRGSALVTVSNNQKTIASQTISYDNGMFDYKHLSFEIEADQLGFQAYTISVKPMNGEFTLKNNSKTIYIEVLDARNKVMLLSNAPHPDVSALKSVLEKDENTQIEAKLISDWDRKLTDVDLIVWHEPGIGFQQDFLDFIQKSGKPIFYFIGPNTTNTVVQKLDIGLKIGSTNQFDEVQPSYNDGFELFELSKELKAGLINYPPLKVRFGEVKIAPQNKVFLKQRLGSIQKQDPLLFFGEKNQLKYGVLLGEGIWRWKLTEFSRSKENPLFNELFQRINQYLIVKQNASALRITPPRRFNSSEEVKIKAEFYNESMELINTPQISFVLRGPSGKSIFTFGQSANFYTLPLGKLNAGSYSWEASTQHNGKKHVKKGAFFVEELALESLDTRANHAILQQISTNSNGKFYPLAKASTLLHDLDQREDIVPLVYEENAYNDLLDYFWILLVLILLFSGEWFLRRYHGAY
jgi:hypothetical protein